jgi:hypothetical protein
MRSQVDYRPFWAKQADVALSNHRITKRQLSVDLRLNYTRLCDVMSGMKREAKPFVQPAVEDYIRKLSLEGGE